MSIPSPVRLKIWTFLFDLWSFFHLDVEPGTISFASQSLLVVIDVLYRNVWNVVKDMLTVESRTNAVISMADVSNRPHSFRDSVSSGYANNLRRF